MSSPESSQAALDVLRKQMRQSRRNLADAQQLLHARKLASNLKTLNTFNNAGNIAAYIAADGEIDPWPVMEMAWSRGKNVYLPVISHLGWERLWFAPASPDSSWRENRFGIPEPVVPRQWWLRASSLDVILLPLVAFDDQGNRLGMGGGFYDRALAFLLNRKHLRQPRLYGMAHSLQQTNGLPRQPWDVPLDGIVTECQILQFRK